MRNLVVGLTLCLLVTSVGAQTLPLGTYTTTITREDILRAFPNHHNPDEEIGKWEIILDDKGGVTLVHNGEVVVEGHFTFTTNQVTFTDEKGRLACEDAVMTGTYNWTFDGTALALTTVDDGCDGRSFAFTVHPLALSTPLVTSVSPKAKLATTWAKIKQSR